MWIMAVLAEFPIIDWGNVLSQRPNYVEEKYFGYGPNGKSLPLLTHVAGFFMLFNLVVVGQ